MHALARQVITYSAAEQLAKDADFRGGSIDPYLQRAKRYYTGERQVFTEAERRAMRIQELHLLDNEQVVLEENPELKAKYAESDNHQLAAAFDSRNLDHYLRHGVDYEFDSGSLNSLRPSLDMDKPLSAQLMRKYIVRLPGLNAVRLNVAYHDIMDHLWAIKNMRKAGLGDKYADFMAEIGNPFTGFLFSKQAELLSGIGYNTRRYTTNPQHYAAMAASPEAITEHMADAAMADERVDAALEMINNSEDLAHAAGFVINGALGSLLLQRSRAGSVKKIIDGANGPEISSSPVSLLDPRYLSIIVEGVDALLKNQKSYEQMQLDLNLTVESLIRECLERGLATGHLALGLSLDTSNIPSHIHDQLINNVAVSTSYYS